MATNHTTNYNLNLWEANDKFVREEFNENTTKLDAAIKAEADARSTAVNAINSALSGKARIAVGTYTGNDNATQTIYVGFTPRAVLVTYCSGSITTETGTYGGLAVSGGPTQINSVEGIAVTSGGFKVAYNSSQAVYTNRSGYSYHYLALA